MTNKRGTALTQRDTGFLRLAHFDMAGMMADELDGLDISFERIKIPSAGSMVFEVPGENPGEPDTVREFCGVILYHHPVYTYYRTPYTGGNNPPDCGSLDGITGRGDPGGYCRTCPYNQFGSGDNGGKACKNRRRLYILREEEIFPLLLSLPPSSLREFSKYVKRLLSRGWKSNSVVTRFSLQKATNAGGITYSRAQFAVDRPLTTEEYALIDKLSAQVREYSRRIDFDADSIVETDIDDVMFADAETGGVM